MSPTSSVAVSQPLSGSVQFTSTALWRCWGRYKAVAERRAIIRHRSPHYCGYGHLYLIRRLGHTNVSVHARLLPTPAHRRADRWAHPAPCAGVVQVRITGDARLRAAKAVRYDTIAVAAVY
ncbi:hypothetical protein D4M24_07945 [Escherichia coli]|nr:hypothetical protein D4M24_07945 [Escherichia coli]